MPLEELTRELVEAIARQHPTLQRLTLARNALRELRFLELLPPLRRLDLSDNRLRSLPPEIAQWGKALEFLDLTGNALESLQQLRVCGELQTLRVGGNQIALYSELKYLQPLLQLRELTLEHNPIAYAPLYRREVVAMLPQLTTLDGRAVSQAERLVATLQQKPQLTVATDPQLIAALPAHDEEGEERDEGGNPELDLSDASSVAWSSGMPLGGLTSPQSVGSPASSVLQSGRKSPATRRPLLTPASLRMSTSEQTARRAVETVNVATQAEERRRIEDERRSLSEASVSSSHTLVKTTTVSPPQQVKSESETLLRSRVKALENILSLQDRMLQDGLTQTAKQQQSASEDPEKAVRVYTQVLAAWRHKVVSLMVQIKSMELQKPTASAAAMGTQQAVEAASAVAPELELWKQKYNDALAQRDLERVRGEQTQRQCENAESKIVRVVRMLATERERVRGVAEEVAVFTAKEGAMTTQLDTLAHATRRLHAYETRLRLLSERVGHASRLVAHREARLRNSEAAIEAERRMLNHKMAASSRSELKEDEARIPGSGKPAFLLRPATEQALRLLFHRLDPYDTGLVSTRTLVDALRSDSGVRDVLGRGGRGRMGDSKLIKIVDHIEGGLRERSSFGGLGGNVTWGELLLLFMPAVTAEDGDVVQDATTHGLSMDDELELPPRFEDADQQKKPTTTVSKRDKQSLQSLSKNELINDVVALRDERLQLQRRVMEDAQRLQSRAQWIQKQWADKTKELTEANDDLHKRLRKQTLLSSELERKLQEAERVSGEAQYQLQSLRRQLSEQAAHFATQKDELEAKCVAGVEREQQVWQREVQDMAFQQTQLQTENAKLELCVRQLEREIAKQRDQREQSESAKVQHLEEKLRKRDDELARLRRERNTILNALRDQEHKVAELTAHKAASSQANASTQTTPLNRTSHSVAIQTSAVSVQPPPSDRRMSHDDITPRAAETQPPRALPRVASTAVGTVPASSVNPQDLHKRLQHLESLTESLLAD